MGGMTLLDEAHAAGLAVIIDGDKLVVRGPRRAEPIARELLANKREVMAVLATAEALPRGRTTEDARAWRDLYEERAALRQYEAGYPRDVAEGLAFGEVVEAWCRRHPDAHDPEACAGCDQPLAGEVLDLPHGARVHWERHREFACLIAYGELRRRRAVAALAELGLVDPGR